MTTYQCREIGESGWRDCSREEYDRLQLDPQHDTRIVDAPVPDWVAGFLNRRTDVEATLRAPLKAQRNGLPVPPPLTPEEMWALADKLSVPEEFKS